MIVSLARKVVAQTKAADDSNIAKTALKGMDVAGEAVGTAGAFLFWIKALAVSFTLTCVLLVVDITVRIAT
jgi:hypothetical protein